MSLSRPPMRVAIVQFWPKLHQVEYNIKKAESVCAKLKPGTVDLVCLPEMAFTGYVFPDGPSIQPYLEEPRTGPTSQFCSSLARQLGCCVMAGYPERLEEHEVEDGADSEGREIKRIGANSAAIYNSEGEWVGGYRKTNLFHVDMSWARPGTGFATFAFPPPLGTTSLGICMDLNVDPQSTWTLEEGPYEIAEHTIKTGSKLLVLLNAWLDSRGVEDEEEEDGNVDWGVLNYWAARLRPLWARKHEEGEDERADAGEETVVVVCNRCGEDNETKFAGSSAVFSMIRNSGRPRLLHYMGRHDEDVALWTI